MSHKVAEDRRLQFIIEEHAVSGTQLLQGLYGPGLDARVLLFLQLDQLLVQEKKLLSI